jgi:mannose-1-phosphate guanylyltransferase/mannose-6-phosphate isomerase
VSALLEPHPRNTAAAIACAALQIAQHTPDALLLILPADHIVPDAEAFAATVRRGLPAAQAGWFVTFGVRPTGPSTAYGYIRVGNALDPHAAVVDRFVEKPDLPTAVELLLDPKHLWNAGIFLVSARSLLASMATHAPDILSTCTRAMQDARQEGHTTWPNAEAFAEVRSQSIDYAVLEHHDKVAVVPFEGAWSDVGSWSAVIEHTQAADHHGNRTVGPAWALDSERTYVHASQRTVVALGLRDTVIVETPDAVLVASTHAVQDVRKVVDTLKQAGAAVATQHRRVAKPWGTFDTLDAGDRFQVKRITVAAGGKLSLQVHQHRAEHWVVVRGTAHVTRGDCVITLAVNESTYIPAGMAHRLENRGVEPLEIIEVQTGSYLGEDDITRLEDAYGRSLN